ncbi:MAG: hypothetical protein F4X92_03640 [Gammaproteobacteria bacterium]|nr:hypothetical protein [Gammaproteobacteria bacterium]
MKQLTALCIGLILSACGGGGAMNGNMEGSGVSFERNTEFRGPWIRVFIEHEEGRELSVNSYDHVDMSVAEQSPVPNHEARRWWLTKVDETEGTSYVTAFVSWDGDNPEDYIMAGWWAQFDNEQPPNLTYQNLTEYAIIDGPEFDPEITPQLSIPTEGTAQYTGPAGGVYWYAPVATSDEGYFILDGWEANVDMTVEFTSGTLKGCIGCTGDFTITDALIPASMGEVEFDITDYEMHLLTARYDESGLVENGIVEIRHPDLDLVSLPNSAWVSFFSHLPDVNDDPRLIGGFVQSDYNEKDGSEGGFFGSFAGLSDAFLATGKTDQ